PFRQCSVRIYAAGHCHYPIMQTTHPNWNCDCAERDCRFAGIIMSRYLRLAGAALACAFAGSALAQQEYPAILAGHAVMPAESFIDTPADAPADLKVSGKYTTGRRVEAIGTVMGKSADRPTGVSLPFKDQPLQGHSGVKMISNGTFWIITDNGYGS